MFKKTLASFMVILLLVPVCAFAQSASPVYVHENPYYSYAYPEGWSVLSAEDVNKLIETGASQSNAASSLVAQVKDMGATVFGNTEADEYIMILSLDLGIDLPAEQMVFALRALLENQAALLPGAQLVNEGETLRLGENDFIKFAVAATAGGKPSMCSLKVVLSMCSYALPRVKARTCPLLRQL